MAEKKLDDLRALKHFTKVEARFEIGGKTFSMKPLVPKKIKKLIQLVDASGKEVGEFKEMEKLLEFVLDRIVQFFPVIFDAEISQEFADENLSLPICMEIGETIVKLNRLEGILPFFKKIIKVTQEVEVPIKESKS